MESSLSVCKDPQAEQNRDTERPKQDVAETQRDRRERSTEGDTLRRETGSQRGEQRDPERETERQRQRDREIEILRKSRETATCARTSESDGEGGGRDSRSSKMAEDAVVGSVWQSQRKAKRHRQSSCMSVNAERSFRVTGSGFP